MTGISKTRERMYVHNDTAGFRCSLTQPTIARFNQTGETNDREVLELLLRTAEEMTREGADYILGAPVNNPRLAHVACQLKGVRVFRDGREIDDIPSLMEELRRYRVDDFKCGSQYKGPDVGTFVFSIPANGRAYNPWLYVVHEGGYVTSIQEERPNEGEFVYTDMFRHGDEQREDILIRDIRDGEIRSVEQRRRTVEREAELKRQ